MWGLFSSHMAQQTTHYYIQRGIHGKTITEHGLTFIAKQTFTVHPHKVLANPEKGDVFDIIFLCEKQRLRIEHTIINRAYAFSNSMYKFAQWSVQCAYSTTTSTTK